MGTLKNDHRNALAHSSFKTQLVTACKLSSSASMLFQWNGAKPSIESRYLNTNIDKWHVFNNQNYPYVNCIYFAFVKLAKLLVFVIFEERNLEPNSSWLEVCTKFIYKDLYGSAF